MPPSLIPDYSAGLLDKAPSAHFLNPALGLLHSDIFPNFFLTSSKSQFLLASTMAAVATEPLLLYSARVCPWAQRATLALQETGLPHSIYEIDLQVG